MSRIGAIPFPLGSVELFLLAKNERGGRERHRFA
jgi:hypothetical protein